MAVKPPPILSPAEAEKFLAALRMLLPEYETIASAVPTAFIQLKTEDSNWPHGERVLRRHIIDHLPAEQRKELEALCKNQLSAEALKTQTTIYGKIETLIRDPEKRDSFLKDVLAGLSRPRLAFTYGLEISHIGLALREAIVRSSVKTPGMFSGADHLAKHYLRSILENIAAIKKEW